MTENNPKTQDEKDREHGKRDAETQMVLGAFIIFISIPVLMGTYWAVRPHAIVVNVIAGSVLLATGIILAVLGRRNAKRHS